MPKQKARRARTAPEGARRKFGLLLSERAIQALERASQEQNTSGTGLIADLVETWAKGLEARPGAPDPAPPTPLALPKEDTLEDFAREVRRAALAAPDTQSSPERRGARFGDGKVFIHAIWEQLKGRFPSWAPFEQRLLEASRAGLLSLARADHAAAMNARDVVESAITLGSAGNFNFVLVPSPLYQPQDYARFVDSTR